MRPRWPDRVEPAEARAKLNQNANLAAQAAEYEKDHSDATQTFESREFDDP